MRYVRGAFRSSGNGAPTQDGTTPHFAFKYALVTLNPLKDELARIQVPETLEGLFALVIHIDCWLQERGLEQAAIQAHPV